MDRFGPTARCPGCADLSMGISLKHAHNDECRNRIAKLLMDEGAQGVESYFDRARVRGESQHRRRSFEFNTRRHDTSIASTTTCLIVRLCNNDSASTTGIQDLDVEKEGAF